MFPTDEDAIREGEPPISPDLQRKPIFVAPFRTIYWSVLRVSICVIGILLAMAALILAGISDRLGGHGAHWIEMNGIAVFLGGILIAAAGVLLTAICGERWAAAATGIAINVLFGISFLPWYVEHEGLAGRGPPHRHRFWELGHVH